MADKVQNTFLWLKVASDFVLVYSYDWGAVVHIGSNKHHSGGRIVCGVKGAIEEQVGDATRSSTSHCNNIVKLNTIIQTLRTELGKQPSLWYACACVWSNI